MSRLFNVIPPDLFNPLAARGAPVYVEVLLRLFAETQSHHQPLSRELATHVVVESIGDPEALALTEEAVAETPPDEPDELQARAGAVLRYLTRCGWLRSEMQSDFTQTYIFPDYAFRLLRVLSEIGTNEALPLQGLICSIHDLLQATLKEGSGHIRLPEAHRQTMHLLNGLRELQHNIGLHIEQVLRQLGASAVLEQLFLTYRDEIVDRVYHQLRTTDHVSRFRPGVLAALKQLEASERVEEAARHIYGGREAPSIEAAASGLLEQMREIRDQFEDLDRLLQAIDVRHSQFVDSAVRTVELHLTASSTTSGQLHAILTHLLANDAGPRTRSLPERSEPLVNLFELSLVDQESLAAPARAPVPFVPEPVAVPVLSPDQETAAREATLRQLTRAISRERVRRFACEALRDREEIRGAEISLSGPDDLPLLIYLRVYGDGSLGYCVEDLPGAAWVELDGIGFRDFVLRPARAPVKKGRAITARRF